MLIHDIIPPSPRRPLRLVGDEASSPANKRDVGGHCLAEALRVSGPKTTIQIQTSKKILAFFTILFLILQFFIGFEPAQALVAISTGSVTRANMRLSIVNGTAFVDFSSAGALTNYIGYKLVITSVTDPTKSITGYIKATGMGETYGGELLSNTTFENTTGLSNWDSTIASVAGGQTGNGLQVTINAGKSYGFVWENFITSNGVLLKGSIYLKLGTGDWIGYKLQDDLGIGQIYSSVNAFPSTWTQYTLYGTTNQTAVREAFSLGTGENETNLIDTGTITQILTPSTTGVTIVSAAGGSIYNWESETSGFNRNDSSGYTYAIYPGSVASTISDTNTYSYQLVDCADTAGQLGVDVTGAATLQNYTVVRCPAGAFQFEESATLTNSIGTSTSNDITIASGKTVTGTYNLFSDAAIAGSGTYSDGGNTTKWSSDPLFVSASDFHLQATSPAIDAGTNLSLTTDYAGISVPRGTAPEIGAYEYPVPVAPTIGTPAAQSDSSIRWNFTDNSDDETGFRLYDNNGALINSQATANLSFIDETGLSCNTRYSGRYFKAYNDYGESAASANAWSQSTDSCPSGGYLPPSNAYANWLAQSNPVPTLTPSPPAGSPQANSPAPPTQAETGSAGSQPSPEATVGTAGQASSSNLPSPQSQPIAPFTKYLRLSQVSADVKRLQIFLNQDSDTQVAKSGAGSPGKETNIFGRLTKAAVIKFQEKYTEDILAPWKLTKGTGFVGKTTTAKINELMGF